MVPVPAADTEKIGGLVLVVNIHTVEPHRRE